MKFAQLTRIEYLEIKHLLQLWKNTRLFFSVFFFSDCTFIFHTFSTYEKLVSRFPYFSKNADSILSPVQQTNLAKTSFPKHFEEVEIFRPVPYSTHSFIAVWLSFTVLSFLSVFFFFQLCLHELRGNNPLFNNHKWWIQPY